MEEGLKSDLLLMTGGVSMGKYDLVEQVFAEMQSRIFVHWSENPTGKPVVFGKCARANDWRGHSTYFFGLPGNPVSTMVTFELFARPMLEALAGMSPRKLHSSMRN